MINIWRMRTNRETSTWLRKISAQRLTMRENLEEAKEFFGGFSGDHRTFVSWNKDFLQKERRMKKEAQERLMGDVGGTGQYNGTPPSNYCPSVARFRFISENYLCEKCGNRFENEAEVMIHIRNVHFKDLRKMFASDAIEHLEADQEYHMWLNAITCVKNDKDLIRELKKANKVLMKRVNEESKDTFKKVNEKKGIIETERVIYSEDGSTKMGVVKEQFAKVTKRKAIDAENIDPDNQKRSASDQRHQTEKVQNVLEHFAGDDIANKANILRT